MEVHVPQGEGAVSGVVSGIFGIFVQYFIQATYGYTDILMDDWLVCEKLTIFPYAEYIGEFCVRLTSYDIVKFNIEVGVEGKFMYKT